MSGSDERTSCPKCGLTFSGTREYCPLCGKKIGDGSRKEDFSCFPVIPLQKQNHIFLQIVTFAALAVLLVTAIVDRMLVYHSYEGNRFFLPMFIGVVGGYAILMVGRRKWKNIRKMVMYEVIIGLLLCMLYDWYTGKSGWSINIIFPLAVVGMNLLYFILAFADRSHQTDYGIYFLITIIGTAIVVILMLTGVIVNTELATATSGIGILLLLAKIIFQGKDFFSELSRRLHL